MAYLVHKVVCLSWFSYSGIPKEGSNAREGRDLLSRTSRWGDRKLPSSTLFYRLPAEGVTQMKGGSSHLRDLHLPTSSDLIKKKKKSPSQVCLAIWVSVNSEYVVKLTTKNNPHMGCSGRYLGHRGHALEGRCGTSISSSFAFWLLRRADLLAHCAVFSTTVLSFHKPKAVTSRTEPQ